jgi:uncharacterized membrane protein HdeD (DUF308 family)
MNDNENKKGEKGETSETNVFNKNEAVIRCLTAIEVKVDNLVKSSQRTIYALIGVIAATLGVKFMGSPWYSIVFTYSALFAGTFALVSTIWEWKRIPLFNKILRLSFLSLLFFSVTCRTFIFEATLGVPDWYTPIVDIVFVIISVIFVISLLTGHNGYTKKE